MSVYTQSQLARFIRSTPASKFAFVKETGFTVSPEGEVIAAIENLIAESVQEGASVTRSAPIALQFVASSLRSQFTLIGFSVVVPELSLYVEAKALEEAGWTTEIGWLFALVIGGQITLVEASKVEARTVPKEVAAAHPINKLPGLSERFELLQTITVAPGSSIEILPVPFFKVTKFEAGGGTGIKDVRLSDVNPFAALKQPERTYIANLDYVVNEKR